MFLLADPEKAVLGLNTFKDLDVQYPDVSGILASAVWSPFPEPAPLLEAPKLGRSGKLELKTSTSGNHGFGVVNMSKTCRMGKPIPFD